MGSKRNELKIAEEIHARLARLENAMWGVIWLLGALCAAMFLAYLWMLARGHALDGHMDAIAASIGGG